MFQVLTCDVVGKIMLALVSTLLIRYMTEADYALYSVAYAFMLVFIQICSGALNRVYVIGFDRFDLKADPGVLARMQLCLLILGAPLLIAIVGVTKPTAWVCAAAMAIGCGTEFIKGRYQQEMRFGRYSSVEFSRAAVVCTGVIAVVWFSGFHPAALAITVVQLVSFLVVFASNKLPQIDLLRPRAWAATLHLARALWAGPYRHLFLYFLVLGAFGQIDLLILRWVGSQHEVATYAVAYRFYNVLLLAVTAANAVLLPSARRVRTRNEAEGLRKQHASALFLYVPAVLLAIVTAGFFIPAIDGGRYPESPTVFRILAISALLSFTLSPALSVVLCSEDFRFLLMAALIACVVGPLVNLLLIPKFGAAGTAWSLVVSLGLMNGAGFWRSLRYGFQESAVAAV